jgi:hypothetical protein
MVGKRVSIVAFAAVAVLSLAGCVTTPSAPDTKPKPNPPALPVISGAATVGNTLTVSTGTWLNSPTSFNYSWERCADAAAISCVEVGLADNYTIMAGDVGYYITVGLTGVNASGTGGSMSAAAVGPAA